jgi:hypothetical protein
MGIPLLRAGGSWTATTGRIRFQWRSSARNGAEKYFAGEDPIGKRIRLRYIDQQTPQEPWLTIVAWWGARDRFATTRSSGILSGGVHLAVQRPMDA